MVMLRSVTVSLAVVGPPLYQTRPQDEASFFFPIPPNRECIESVDMVLHIPVAVDYFYEYLTGRQTQFQEEDAIHFFSLYIDLRMYDKACSDEESEAAKRQIAEEIYAEYLSEEQQAQFFVALDPQVKMLFQNKFDQIEDNLNEYLFIEVYAYVLDKLRVYFNMFKNSQAFVQLEDEIRRQERLYEVLVEASLIDN